jgi:L(+)-tartrate dehydratase alpha subunit
MVARAAYHVNRMPITIATLEDAAVELNRRAAVATPVDARRAHKAAADRETNPLARYVLNSLVDNAELAIVDDRPMCGDTGLPRYYVKVGNAARIEGGFAAFEHALRTAVARATQDVKLRSNRVHPLTRRNPGNNVGVFAPNIDYRFHPDGDWIDITAVHKGGLFGSDYRMLFPGDGIGGIKRFVVDTIAAFHRRGLACPPAIIGVGIGGTKDQSFTLSKEASCLRLVGDRHPDPTVAQLEDELLELCNSTQMGVMGLKSQTAVVDVHCEIAYTHTGGLPVGVSELCTAVRRATVRLRNDGQVEFREDPEWFDAYMRREGVDFEATGASPTFAPAAAPTHQGVN